MRDGNTTPPSLHQPGENQLLLPKQRRRRRHQLPLQSPICESSPSTLVCPLIEPALMNTILAFVINFSEDESLGSAGGSADDDDYMEDEDEMEGETS